MAKKERNSKRKKPNPKGPTTPPASVALVVYESSTDREERQKRARNEYAEKDRAAGEEQYKRRLDRDLQHEVCLLIAMGHSDRYIAAEMNEKYTLTMHWTNISHTYRHGEKWQSLIKAFKKKYISNISRHAISEKGWRLLMIQKSIVAAAESGEHKTVATLISQAQNEIEGAKPTVEVHTHNTKVTFNGKDGIDPSKIKEMPIGDSIRDINDRLSAQFIG